MTRDALAEFEALFNDEAADELAKSDRATDRLVDLLELSVDAVEHMILHGEPTAKLNAIAKILPLATKVAEKRQNAEMDRVIQTARAMFLEMFPERAAIEELNEEIDAEFEIPVFEELDDPDVAPVHDPGLPELTDPG